MLRAILVMIHAGTGIAGLLAGLAALSPRDSGTPHRIWARRLYNGCVCVLLLSMVMLIVADWRELDLGARLAFSGLSGLGAVMAYRLGRAAREIRHRETGWEQRYIGHVYFTYISLWIGFLIVPALNLPAPQTTVPVVVVATLVAGHAVITRYQRRVLN